MTQKTKNKAVLLCSGGVDSSTCLAIALSRGFECYALSFDYQQRNLPELEAAKRITKKLGAKEHRIVTMDFGQWGASALTDEMIDIPHQPSQDIPMTYVPARNSIFLSVAMAWAEVLGSQDIFIGANVLDYSNYPDCRPEYLRAFETMANLATRAGVDGKKLNIHAPLLQLSKAEIIREGIRLGVDYSLTWSCYDPQPNNLACGQCDSCRFRAKGFREAGIDDPTQYAAHCAVTENSH